MQTSLDPPSQRSRRQFYLDWSGRRPCPRTNAPPQASLQSTRRICVVWSDPSGGDRESQQP